MSVPRTYTPPGTTDPGDAPDVRTDIQVDEAVVEELIKALQDAADSLAQARPGEVAPATLGGSNQGANLGHHTALAHQKLDGDVGRIVASLRQYVENIKGYRTGVENADADAGSRAARTAARLSGVRSPGGDV